MKMTEAQLQQAVMDLAAIRGWEQLHLRPAQTAKGWRVPVQGSMGKGWPDLTLVRGSRIIFVELKGAKGTLTPDQLWVLDRLRLAAEVYVWKPEDWDTIVEVLG